MNKGTFWSLQTLTAILLMLGSVLFLVGAGTPVTDSSGNYVYTLPAEQGLRIIYRLPVLWQWATWLFVSGTVVGTLGYVLLGVLLREAGDRAFTNIGRTLLLAACVILLTVMAARMSIDYPAAQVLMQTGVVPDYYTALDHWTSGLFTLYTVLILCGTIAYAISLLVTRLLPRWLGVVVLIYCLALLVTQIITSDMAPFTHQLWPVVIGIMLLLPRYRVSSQQNYATIS
jgi:hypothetical protein